MIKSNIQGQCPFCNSYNLDYGSAEFEDNMLYFPWTCKECGETGEEWYILEFMGHNALINDNMEQVDNYVVINDEIKEELKND